MYSPDSNDDYYDEEITQQLYRTMEELQDHIASAGLDPEEVEETILRGILEEKDDELQEAFWREVDPNWEDGFAATYYEDEEDNNNS